MKNKIFCAIDTTNIDQALSWVKEINPHIHGIKLGMEFFYTHGHSGVMRIIEVCNSNTQLFLDLKFHDIPNTVAGAMSAVLPLRPDFLTLHAGGGKEMMTAAKNETNDTAKILAVTILTHMTALDLQSLGFNNDLETQVCRYAEVALNAGVDGLVCSPHEISILRKEFGNEFSLIVPGIRPANSNTANDDQNRIMSPKEALDLGATYLVIGRPITKANNPAQSAQNIINEISSCVAVA